ncbi:MAG: hypothetical protein ABSC93_30325 [Bryobacteraceae bacterium]|jgi:VWFA-related protein
MAFETAIRTALALTLCPVVGILAQAPEPTAALRVNTQLVEVSVVMKDGHGSPVTDLQAGDFEIYDQGKKQAIRVFKREDYRPSAAQPPASPAPIAPHAPSADWFSNRTAAEHGAPNAPTILVIDAGIPGIAVG